MKKAPGNQKRKCKRALPLEVINRGIAEYYGVSPGHLQHVANLQTSSNYGKIVHG